MAADEVGQDELQGAMAAAEQEGRLLHLLRSPERVEELLRLGALRLDFDLALSLSGGLAAQGDREVAHLVATAAIAADDRKVAAAGELALAWLHLTAGDTRSAQATLDGLAGWTDLEVLGEAEHLSGVILQEAGKTAEAESAYQRAMNTPRRRTAGMAALDLADLFTDDGDLDAAVEALSFAYECGDPYAEAEAALKLALLRDQFGDAHGAIPFYEEAAESGLPSVAPRAAFNLGDILDGAGDVAGARAAFLSAVEMDDPEFSPKAALNLGVILMDEERVSEAYQCFSVAVESPDPGVSSRGHCYLGTMLAGDRPEVAERHLRTALETGDQKVQEMASRILTMMKAR